MIEVKDLKTGDEVKCLEDHNDGFNWKKGETYLVKKVSSYTGIWDKGDVFLSTPDKKPNLRNYSATMGFITPDEYEYFEKVEST